MTDRERAQKLFDSWMRMGKDGCSYDPVRDIAYHFEQIRLETARACAEECEQERDRYRENAKRCAVKDNRSGEMADINGSLGCENCASAIRARFGGKV